MYYTSWEEAMEFCSKLSQLEKRSEGCWMGICYLAHEAHWEYACRAGTDTATASATVCPAFANFDGYPTTDGWNRHPTGWSIGKYRANAWGARFHGTQRMVQ